MRFPVLTRALVFSSAFSLSLLSHVPAKADELPDPVVRIITEAVKSGDAATLQATVGVSKKAYPKDAVEIDHLVAELKAEADVEHLAMLRRQTFRQGWKGEGEVGASRNTGTTDDTDIAIGLHLAKDGIQWRHKFDATADYQHTRGGTGASKYLVGYEPNYKLNAKLFTFGLLQWEKDRPDGFDNRVTESFGLGYSLVHTPKVTWDITAGPAFRQIDQVAGAWRSDTEARLATQVAWHMTPASLLTENISVYAGGGDSTYQSTTAVTTTLISHLAARASFDVKKETHPSPGLTKGTDTTSRVTLVYGF